MSTFRFLDSGHGFEYKQVSAAARYWRESCNPAQTEYQGGEEIPIDIVVSNGDDSKDLLHFDASARYLGPGLGEM